MKKINVLIWIACSWAMYPLIVYLSSRRSIEKTDRKRILIMPQLTRIGDIVCSTPVFYNIKKSYPDSYISVLVSKKAIDIIKNNIRIDNIIIIEDYTTWGLIKKIQSERIEWSINLTATSVNTYLTFLGLIPNRIKTVVEKPPITEKITDSLSNYRLMYKNHTYLPRHHLKLLKFMGIDDTVDKKEVFLSNSGNEKVLLLKKGLPLNHKIIGLSITAGNKIKELGDHKFKIIADELLKIDDVVIFCLGSKNDKNRIDNFTKGVSNSGRCFAVTDFNLEELPSLMKCFSLYIAVDTGPIYIAHALGIPLIDIIGPVDPREQPPNDANSIQILPKGGIEPSSFVFKERGSLEDIKSAIDSINIADIISEAKKFLD